MHFRVSCARRSWRLSLPKEEMPGPQPEKQLAVGLVAPVARPEVCKLADTEHKAPDIEGGKRPIRQATMPYTVEAAGLETGAHLTNGASHVPEQDCSQTKAVGEQER